MIAASQASRQPMEFAADLEEEESEVLVRPMKETEGAIEEAQPEVDVDSSMQIPDMAENLEATKAYHSYQKHLLDIIRETFVSQAAMVYIANPSEEQLVLQDISTQNEITPSRKIPLDDNTIGAVFRNKEPHLWNVNGDGTDKIGYYPEEQDVRSFLGVPVSYQNHVIGVLSIESAAKESYSPDDHALLSQFADLISIAMEQFDTIDKLQEERIFYARLCEVNTSLTTTYNKDELFEKILSIGRNLFDYDSLTIVLLQEENSMQAEIAAQDGTSTFEIGYRFEIEQSAIRQAIQDGKTKLYSKISQEQSVYALTPELSSPDDVVRSMLIVPIRNHEESYGALVLQSTEPGKFNRQDEDVLKVIGSVFGAGLNRFYLYRYMRHIASRDGLTGVYNYRAFRERLEEEIQRSTRYQNTFTLCIADLDKFKNVNDTHGHLYGDFMLKEVARIIRNSVRSVDIVARYGGEEFAIILVNSSASSAEKTATRIRKAIDAYQFQHDNITEHITISIGMAEFPFHGDDADSLTNRADQAMYEVKKIGGNSVKTYENTTEIKGV
ncbi:MAG: diguanylate cyclase [Candidatus Marinimicrobia bacterium]|nr:diguanylate cyclase [Candidatus Neomarinimicrobiota bacterium]